MSKIAINPSNIVVFQLIYNIIVKYLIHDFGFPPFLNYITDLLTVLLVIIYLKDGWLVTKMEISIIVLSLLFLLMGFFSVLVNNESFILYFWSLRVYGRFFIWILICARYFKLDNLNSFFNISNKLLVVNFILMIYQFVFLNLRSDYLNGFFGAYTGGNSALNTLFVILTIYNLVSWLFKLQPAKQSLFYISLMCIMSAMNEIKYYYVELAIITILTFIFMVFGSINKKLLIQTIRASLVLLFLTFIGYKVLIIFYPGFNNFFEVDVFYDYLTRSYNSEKILYVKDIPISNRFSSYMIINEYFHTDIIHSILGIGMGASEVTAFFQSQFSELFGEIAISGYVFPQVLLESGFIGLFLYVSLYCVFFVNGLRMAYREDDLRNKSYYFVSAITSILGMFMCVYNSALKIESSGYMFFFIMAIPYMIAKKEEVK